MHTVDNNADFVDVDSVLTHYDPVMGIEVHVELSTTTKMFSAAQVSFGDEPNTHVSPVCLGLPGALPKVNEEAVRRAIQIGLALNCSISSHSEFARKNYFYPDQPKNYQISQFDKPIAYDGYIDVPLDDGTEWRVEIERAHMEEDTGKSTHKGSTDGRLIGASHSLIDYNRAGIPLIEIVTKPIEGAGRRAGEIARAYVAALRDIIADLGVSEARMDRGSLRCDANVSLRPINTKPFGTRTETKNMNSLKSVELAVEYELMRQAQVLSSGGTVIQETRHFNENDGTTSSGRIKETAEDYRYFPDPDLTPIEPSLDMINEIKATIPERPWIRKARLQEQWQISDEIMRDLVNLGAIDPIIKTVEAGAPFDSARAWWTSFLAAKANEAHIALDELGITPVQLAAVIDLVAQGKLTNKLAQYVVEQVLAGQGDPQEIVDRESLLVVRDDAAMKAWVDTVIAENQDTVDAIRGGKVQAVGRLVGSVMKASKGKADAALVKEMILAYCEQN